MGFNQLQHTQSQNGSSAAAVTIAYGSNVTAGSLLVLTVATYNASITVAVTDSQGNTWAQAGPYSIDGSVIQSIWYVASAKAGATTVTVTPSATMLSSLGIIEFSGPAASPLDATAKGHLSSSAIYAGPVGISNNAELVIAAFSQSSANLSSTIPDGGYALWMNETQGRAGAAPSAGGAAAFKIAVAPPSDYGTNFYLDQSVDAAWAMASFIPATSPIIPPGGARGPLARTHTKDNQHDRQHQLLTDIINSLVAKGQLVRTGADTWKIQP